jgi:hypothetical protein
MCFRVSKTLSLPQGQQSALQGQMAVKIVLCNTYALYGIAQLFQDFAFVTKFSKVEGGF